MDEFQTDVMTDWAGALVVSLDHRDLGIGKVASVAGHTIAVEYFDSVANPVAQRVSVAANRLRSAPLDVQQRVWYRHQDQWRVARLMEIETGRVRVRPSGDLPDVWLGIEEMYVRWDRPLADPIAVMQTRELESPHYFFARRRFIDGMLEQDAAARGQRALTSSAIELYDHQIDVATRVLSDPIQRFLLADEVGMGKTIEAGIVVRQHLLDNPHGTVRVVVPERLCEQWQRELAERFFVDDFTSARVDVLPSSHRTSWSKTGPGGAPELLVIDEAHHVARWAHMPGLHQARFEAVAALAHATPGLLLLSATPVAHNESTYLAMLHLLDPDNHRLDDLELFRDRVDRRHDLARTFALFRPGQRYRRLERNADAFRELLAGDTESLKALDAMLALGPEGPQDDLDRRIRALRLSVTDRHRIHYRMLRSRRDVADDFPVRGRCFAHALETSAEHVDELAAWWDQWRDALIADAEPPATVTPVVGVMLDRLLAYPDMFTGAVHARLGHQAQGEAACLTHEEADVLRALPVGPLERDALEERLQIDDGGIADARTKAIVDYVWSVPRRRKIVVFTTFATTAVRIARALEQHLDDGQVVVHVLKQSAERWRDAARRFRDERACNVLVCDASAEEGLNLQFADMILHAELPVDPNRLEQRIGRLDRHGPDTSVENVVLTEGRDGSVLDGWLVALRDGFGIFERSVSSFQFVIDRLMPELVAELVERGPAGVITRAASIPDQLEAERREIADQDQLDAIEAIELTHAVADGLRAADQAWQKYEDAAERLICRGKGQLRFTRREHFQNASVSSYWAADPLRGGEPLIPQRDLTAYMNGTFSESERVLYGTYDRGIVLRRPGTRLWAAGDPFLDGLVRYVRERDDRGRAYAFWRRQPCLDKDAVIAALRFDFIVEPMLPSDHATTDAEQLALSRRAHGLLPPTTETVWIGVDDTEVTDPKIVGQLASRYSSDFGDIRLNGSRWETVDRALPGIEWEPWCRAAHVLAVDAAQAREDVTSRIATAGAAAERHGLARIEALRGRTRLGADADALAFEERAAEIVGTAVSAPRFVLDAMGLVILSFHPFDAL